MTGPVSMPYEQTKTFWTEARVVTLRELFDAGRSGGEIAAEMGAQSRNQIIGKLHRLGLKRETVAGASAHGFHATKRIRPPKSSNPKPKPFAAVNAVRLAIRRQIDPGLDSFAETLPADLDMSTTRVTLIAATSEHCRWPAADDGSATMVCGAKPIEGSAWCPFHAHRARVTAPPRKKSGSSITGTF